MKLYAKHLLTEKGWLASQIITIEHGQIVAIYDGNVDEADCVKNIVIPGMVNCHSHAFQRAFAGFS